MDDIILRKIQNVLKDHNISRYDYLSLSNYFQRLYVEASIQSNIIKYIDENKSRIQPDKLVFEE